MGSIPGLRRSPEGGNSNSLQFLAWKIAWKVEPGGLHSMGLQRFGHDRATEHTRRESRMEDSQSPTNWP